ncbi:hypothetical protein JY651_30090 [Pyxidicoccus parkwayensis]|uniref:Uncharacterized protein n=1 Tax=Pyxidicoccus parkwayensis TaxID=2813578 RepID=A0ABX7NPV1_9BACT|nr:hypothetical protein JY651_30090 [Pyxidicoccus parkwaysis]
MTEAAFDVERFDDTLEGSLLMGKRFEGRGAHLSQQCGERSPRVHASAQHQRVDEQADDILGGRVRAPRHGSTDAQLVLSGVALQQSGERGVQRHERSDLMPAAHLSECPSHGSRQAVPTGAGTPVAQHGRTRPVRGQRQQRRSPRQLLLPVFELRLLASMDLRRALPRRHVREVQQRRGKRRRALRTERRMCLRQLAQEDIHRRAVHGHVMQHEQQHVMLGRQAEKAEAIERAALQRERTRGLFSQSMPGQLPRGGRRLLYLKHLRGDRVQLRRRMTFTRDEGGAQHGVAFQQQPQRGLQRRDLHRAVQLHGLRELIGAQLGLELVQEPHALLREGHARFRPRRQALGRGQRKQPGARGPRFDDSREPLHGGRGEQRGQGQLHAEGLTHARHQSRGAQRMATQLEEVGLA